MGRGVGLSDHSTLITHLLYADDLVLMGLDHETLECMLYELGSYADRIGHRVNASRTCVMHFHASGKVCAPVFINTAVLERVKEFKYLGMVHWCLMNNCS